ncbi:hypothetical protein QNM99_16860 [Pseudomonas sp. PCH446]
MRLALGIDPFVDRPGLAQRAQGEQQARHQNASTHQVSLSDNAISNVAHSLGKGFLLRCHALSSKKAHKMT